MPTKRNLTLACLLLATTWLCACKKAPSKSTPEDGQPAPPHRR